MLGTAVDDQLVDVLDDHTAGMPGLVRLVLAAWLADGTVVGGRLPRSSPGHQARHWWPRCAEVDQLLPRRARCSGR